MRAVHRVLTRESPPAQNCGMTHDLRRQAPSAARNRDPILEILRRVLPPRGTVLEIASGTGEHAAYFAAALPGLVFQPSDPDAGARLSIDAWAAAGDLTNMRHALALDASANWPLAHADAVVCINMIHISPWPSTLGLLRGAARVLAPGGLLYLYGPYRRNGGHTAPSNAAFDADLRSRDPAWGIRDLEPVAAVASEEGFGAPEVIEMPANNLSVIFSRQ
jgi:SAM-dependent methyltransferase